MERRCELRQLSVVHLAIEPFTDIVFYFLSLKYIVLLLTEGIIIQLEPWKQNEKEILEEKFYGAPDFELKFSKASVFEISFKQCVRFF